MAIIIPSANIYAMQNDKILDNQISGVDVEENKIIVKNDYVGKTEKCVLIECINDDGGKGTFGPYTYYGTSTYTEVYNSDKNPQKNNTYIDTTHSNTYDMYRTDFTIDLSGYILSTNFLSTVQIESYSTVEGEKSIYADNEFRGTTHYGTDTYTQIQSPNTSINHIGIGEASLINNKLSFSVYINKSIKSGVTVIGTSIYPIEYEIRIKGNFIEAETIANSYGTKSNLSLQSNGLIQTTTKNGPTKISEYLANNIIYSYENGKETATIRCSINDYYNEDTTIAKSITDTTKDMTFRMYDNVIPMIPSQNGDVPMSKYKEGASKIFKVLGTKLINNGAVWQELTLQERFRAYNKNIKFEIDGTGTNTISARANSTSGTTTGISSNRTMQYSLNGENWNSWNGSALTITTSQPIYLRSNITADGGDGLYTNFFFGNSTTKIKCSGDMRYMAMTNNYAEISNTVPFTYCYFNMFSKCTSLTTAPSLPATTLATDCYSYMFWSCTSLTTAPSLPATTLATDCYSYMFWSCTSLTTAPSLPATALTTNCYYSMFRNCTSLTTAPSLPATTLANSCYHHMFANCTSLTTAPSLPATTLADSCYSTMFGNCTSLTTAPSLPATTLTTSCYYYMFGNCTSLTTAPSLPATTLATDCYSYMLYGCTSLTTAPSLPATTLATDCYSYMFYKCTSLTTAPSLPATTLATRCYYEMFYNCTSLTQVLININNNTTIPTNALTDMLASTGTVSQPPNAIVCDRTTIIADTNATSRWIRQPNAVQDEEEYIKFEIDGDGANTINARANSVSGTTTGISSNRTMQYSLNGENWNSWNGSALTITTSQPIYLRSNITANGRDGLYTNFFFGNSTSKIKCSGDMRYMAMTNNYAEISNTVPFTYCYYRMFQSCTSLTAAPSLPATTLATACYYYMFVNCNSLTTAPSLPATTLAESCYSFMFSTCTSLTAAPSLPATTLANFCYYYMFNNCTSLTTAPSLPATTLAESCYRSMFYGCTSLTTAPSLPATTLANYCYWSMFSGCTSLTTAPSLPVTTLASACYRSMFENCTSLTTAPSLPATTLADYCYYYMFYNCTSLTTAPSLPATTLATECYSYMFGNCTSLTTAPSLPATTLTTSCYYYMFGNCTSLTTAPSLPATTLANYCYWSMFSGCTSLTTAPSLPATTLATDCYSYMFYKCTSLTTITLYYGGGGGSSYFNYWVNGISTEGVLYKAGTQFASCGKNTYPCTWTQVQI